VKRLKGSRLLRLRVGDYRVSFTDEGVILTIVRVGHRKDVYE
jgi:mRNA-degrading endonuclease RelE of RelBE toxin-antitoxin system